MNDALYMYWSVLYCDIMPRVPRKIHRHLLHREALMSSITPFELPFKEFVNISYENVSFLILETLYGCQFIYF